MSIAWPPFWSHIPEADRPAMTDVLGDLLGAGVLFGDAGRDQQLFQIARQYQREIEEYLAPLGIELVPDPERPIFQARPVPGGCPLTARFGKDETLLVLTLWRIYDDHRMTQTTETVLLTANELDARLRLYFENVVPPTPSHLDRMLVKLRRKRLIRYQPDAERAGESRIEVLPTLARAIPFENAGEWEQQADLYRAPAIPAAMEDEEP